MFSVKGGLPLFGWLLKATRVAVGSMTPSGVKVLWTFLVLLRRLRSSQGFPGVVKYLKASSVMLQQAVGGDILKDPSALGPKVSRTRSGFPRVIPAIHRARIRAGDPTIIRLWLTLFSIYRVLEFPGTLKLSTITDPGKDISRFQEEFLGILRTRVRFPKVETFTLGGEPYHISKSSPSSSRIGRELGESPVSTSFESIVDSAWSVMNTPHM